MAAPLLVAVAAEPALAQKSGGILKMYSPDSPASMSIHEEATFVAEGPMMGVFNNLVILDQHAKQNTLGSIVPDLATGWSWNEDGTDLTFPLRDSVRWHDGKPFTAQDVRCTFDLLTGKSSEKLRVNPRKSWYRNLEAVTTNGDYQVTFHLKRPQPAFLTALAGGGAALRGDQRRACGRRCGARCLGPHPGRLVRSRLRCARTDARRDLPASHLQQRRTLSGNRNAEIARS